MHFIHIPQALRRHLPTLTRLRPCVLCGLSADTPYFCTPCRHSLPTLAGAQCPCCALPTFDNQRCGDCLNHPPAFNRIHCQYRYDAPLSWLIGGYKFQRRWHLASALSTLMHLNTIDPDALITPIPLHPSRLAERGFNQAAELARRLAKRENLAYHPGLLLRTHATHHQITLPIAERRHNVQHAFKANPTEIAAHITGRHLILIDDVMTTGATLDAAARTLKAAGAREVSGWIIARTL